MKPPPPPPQFFFVLIKILKIYYSFNFLFSILVSFTLNKSSHSCTQFFKLVISYTLNFIARFISHDAILVSKFIFIRHEIDVKPNCFVIIKLKKQIKLVIMHLHISPTHAYWQLLHVLPFWLLFFPASKHEARSRRFVTQYI